LVVALCHVRRKKTVKATETLKHEHQIVLLILGAAERAAQRASVTGKVRAAEVGKMVEFFQNFVDRCHHAKEERHLFPKVAERGEANAKGTIRLLLAEHDVGRQWVKALTVALPLARKGDAAAVSVLASALKGYAALLRSHIDREDNGLFPLADRLLTPQDARALVKAFDQIEAEEIGEGVHEKYHQLAHELAEH
jgi:hemerythrin-like domain-containing protein